MYKKNQQIKTVFYIEKLNDSKRFYIYLLIDILQRNSVKV